MVQAESPASCVPHAVSGSVGVNSAGTVQFCVRAPSEVPSQDDNFRLSATLTSPALSGSNPTLTIAVTSISGCAVVGAPEAYQTPATNAQGPSVARSWNITQDARHCTLNLRATVKSGTTTVSELDQVVNVRTATDWWDTFGLFVYAVWIVLFVLTRFIRGLFSGTLRVLVDVVSAAGVLALPIPADQFQLIAIASYVVVMVDLFAVLLRPGAA